MCRSIKTLRPPMATEVGPEDVHAAALQYVRKISGFRAPSTRNREAFDAAVEAVAAATQVLLDGLEVRIPASTESAERTAAG
ncbi:MAG TPA: DUF2277 domain-containing protein [Actinospica sp.]|nr:DUF2277 domain-containing protein [Actinospica sp.]